jgi:hypothetical protein
VLDVVAPVIPAIREVEVRKPCSEANPGKSTRTYLKSRLKKTGLEAHIAQVVEHLSSKCEALGSNPSTAKQTNKQKKLATANCC